MHAPQKKKKKPEHQIKGAKSPMAYIKVSACGVRRARAGVQVSQKKLHIHKHLD